MLFLFCFNKLLWLKCSSYKKVFMRINCIQNNYKNIADVVTRLNWILELMVQVRNYQHVNHCDDYRACVDGLFVENNRLKVKMVGIYQMPYKKYKEKQDFKEVEELKRAMDAWSVGVCVYYIIALQ